MMKVRFLHAHRNLSMLETGKNGLGVSTLVVVCLLTGQSQAEATVFPDINAFEQALHVSLLSPETLTRGDLNGDGLEDVSAAWVSNQSEKLGEQSWSVYRVFVLLGNTGGGFHLYEQSMPLTLGCGTSVCGVKEIAIRNKKLEVTMTSSWHGCVTNELFRFQATQMGMQWVNGLYRNLNDGSGYSSRIDVNALTGQVDIRYGVKERHTTSLKQMERFAPRYLRDFEGMESLGWLPLFNRFTGC